MWNLNDVIEIEYRSGYCYRVFLTTASVRWWISPSYLDRGRCFCPCKIWLFQESPN